MKKKILSALFLPVLINMVGCTVFNNTNSGSGSIKMSVKFPDKKFSVKFIPANTHIIIVLVSGSGIPSNKPIAFNLSSDETSKIVSNVPQGDKLIKVTALGSDGELLAEGNGNVNIIASQINRAEVELKAINKPVNPEPSPTQASPSSLPSECVINIRKEDTPLSAGIEQAINKAGCKIVVDPAITPSPTFTPSGSPTPSETPLATPTPTTLSGGGGGGIPVTDSSNNSVPVTVGVNNGTDSTDNTLKAQ